MTPEVDNETTTKLAARANRCLQRMGLPYSPATPEGGDSQTVGYFAAAADGGAYLLYRYTGSVPGHSIHRRKLVRLRSLLSGMQILSEWTTNRRGYTALFIDYVGIVKWEEVLDLVEHLHDRCPEMFGEVSRALETTGPTDTTVNEDFMPIKIVPWPDVPHDCEHKEKLAHVVAQLRRFRDTYDSIRSRRAPRHRDFLSSGPAYQQLDGAAAELLRGTGL